LEIDETLADAHAVLAKGKADNWEFAVAENGYQRAIELNPNLAIAHQWYSELLSNLGRYDEAIAEIRRAYELDPFSRAVIMNLGLRYHDARQFDEAIVHYKNLIENEPDYPWSYIFLAAVYEEKGMYDEAIDPRLRGKVLLKTETPDGARLKAAGLRHALETGGAQAYWRASLEHDIQSYKQGNAYAFAVATKYARLGQKDRVFEWLEKEFADGSKTEITFLKNEPAFDSLVNDPRFQNLLRRIGLPQ
jgi:tetratricopeptide (TPR) repeat protein